MNLFVKAWKSNTGLKIRNFVRKIFGLPPIVRTVKPTGSISLVSVTVGGVEPRCEPYYKRTVNLPPDLELQLKGDGQQEAGPTDFE